MGISTKWKTKNRAECSSDYTRSDAHWVSNSSTSAHDLHHKVQHLKSAIVWEVRGENKQNSKALTCHPISSEGQQPRPWHSKNWGKRSICGWIDFHISLQTSLTFSTEWPGTQSGLADIYYLHKSVSAWTPGGKGENTNTFITMTQRCRLTGFINQQSKDQYLHTFISS